MFVRRALRRICVTISCCFYESQNGEKNVVIEQPLQNSFVSTHHVKHLICLQNTPPAFHLIPLQCCRKIPQSGNSQSGGNPPKFPPPPLAGTRYPEEQNKTHNFAPPCPCKAPRENKPTQMRETTHERTCSCWGGGNSCGLEFAEVIPPVRVYLLSTSNPIYYISIWSSPHMCCHSLKIDLTRMKEGFWKNLGMTVSALRGPLIQRSLQLQIPYFQQQSTCRKYFISQRFSSTSRNHSQRNLSRVHAKGVVLCERTCFCLLSAFYKMLPSKNPSNLCWKPLQAPSKNPSKKHLLPESLLRTLLKSVLLQDPLGVHPIIRKTREGWNCLFFVNQSALETGQISANDWKWSCGCAKDSFGPRDQESPKSQLRLGKQGVRPCTPMLC